MLQLEFEKGRVLVACKGTLRREAPKLEWVWEGVTPSRWVGLGDLPQENFEKETLKKAFGGYFEQK